MDQNQRKKAFFAITNKRLRDQGWENVTQFTKDSGIEYSAETVRRAFTDVPDKTLAPDTLAIILFKLNYSTEEVKELLETYTDTSNKDRYLWPKLGDNNITLTLDEEAVLNIYRKVIEHNNELRTKIADQLALVAMLASVDVSSEVKQLQRKQKR